MVWNSRSTLCLDSVDNIDWYLYLLAGRNPLQVAYLLTPITVKFFLQFFLLYCIFVMVCLVLSQFVFAVYLAPFFLLLNCLKEISSFSSSRLSLLPSLHFSLPLPLSLLSVSLLLFVAFWDDCSVAISHFSCWPSLRIYLWFGFLFFFFFRICELFFFFKICNWKKIRFVFPSCLSGLELRIVLQIKDTLI